MCRGDYNPQELAYLSSQHITLFFQSSFFYLTHGHAERNRSVDLELKKKISNAKKHLVHFPSEPNAFELKTA